MSKQPTGSYPKSQYPGQYPVQQNYPNQGFTQYGVSQQQYGMQQQQQVPQQPIHPSSTFGYPRQNVPAGYGVPPPPYTTDAPPTLAPTLYSSPQPVTSGYNPYPTAGYPQMNVINPVPTAVFDAGARFTAGATVNIPPPPPGALPTQAQVAAAQGQPVVMQQKQGSWFSGGSDGGATFW